MVDKMIDHPFILTILIIASIFLVGYVIANCVEYSPSGFKPFHYEYTSSDGNKHEAAWCGVPYRQQVHCELEDGTKVFDVKEYRKVVDE